MADEIPNSHDRYAKHLLTNPQHALDLARSYLPPEIARWLDGATLERLPSSWAPPDLSEHFSDVMFQVVRPADAGGANFEIRLSLLFDHKSKHERWTPLQLLRYAVCYWCECARDFPNRPLPLIIPIVFYHARPKWRHPLDIQSLFGDLPAGLLALAPVWRQFLIDLSPKGATTIQGPPLVRAALLLLRAIFQENIEEELTGILPLLSPTSPVGLECFQAALTYIIGAADITKEKLAAAIRRACHDESWVQIMETIESRARGKGRLEGQLEIVSRQLRKKFGVPDLSPELSVRLQRLPLETLAELADALLEMGTPADLARWLDSRGQARALNVPFRVGSRWLEV